MLINNAGYGIVGAREETSDSELRASKFALERMSEALAAELAAFGIKVLIVEPGAFRTGEVASPVVGSAHKLKYSLFYGVNGKRLVGYDNERGKGDHRHIEDRQERYVFKTVELLMADFLADVRRLRGE